MNTIASIFEEILRREDELRSEEFHELDCECYDCGCLRQEIHEDVLLDEHMDKIIKENE